MANRTLDTEHQFLQEEQAVKSNGAFIYKSEDGAETIQLDNYLADYKEWLIEKGIVKEVDDAFSKTPIIQWLESEGKEASGRLKTILQWGKPFEFIEDVTEFEFMKLRNAGVKSWEEFRRLRSTNNRWKCGDCGEEFGKDDIKMTVPDGDTEYEACNACFEKWQKENPLN